MSPHSFQLVTENNKNWSLTTTTIEGWDALLIAIRNAETSICIETFIFIDDTIGKIFIKLLIEKALQGVRVRCVFDSMGCRTLASSPLLPEMEKAGIQIKFFNWMLPFSKNNKKFLYFRNHRRLFIFDEKIMFTGGICIGKKMENWQETMIQVEDPVVEQAVRVFNASWHLAYKKHTLQLGRQTKNNRGAFSYITQAPLPKENHLYNRLIESIRHAKKSIYLTTPYFCPDRRLLRVLLLARRRNVEVNILIPKKSNHPWVDIASHTYFHKILKNKVKIFLYDKMIHSKSCTVDDDWGFVGSLNMDNISLRYNFESALIITNRNCISEIQSIFQKDLEDSTEMTQAEWEKRSIFSKIKELLIWPFRKLM